MTHLTLQELFDYTAGGVSSIQRAEIERHLAECPWCHAQIKFERSLLHAVRTSPAAPPSEELTARIMSRLESAHRRSKIPRAHLFLSRIFLALSSFALVAVAVIFPPTISSFHDPLGSGTASEEILARAMSKVFTIVNGVHNKALEGLASGAGSSFLQALSYAIAILILLWLFDRHVGGRILQRRVR